MRRLERGSKLVVASHNKGKVWEINQLIQPYGLDAVSAGDLGLAEPAETETTFRGNALIKAKASAVGSGLPALADDSGLEIDALDGAPGVYSADWAGRTRDFSLAMSRVNDELAKRGAWKAESPPRANFISVLCLCWPDGAHEFYEGRVFGHVVWPARGGNGFGYDPMFVPEGDTRTYGEMEPAEKYAGSHRTRAFAKFKAECLEHIGVSTALGHTSGRELAALTAAAANLSTQEELAQFVLNLRADLAKSGTGWENATLQSYLEAISAHLNDAKIGDEPKWRTIAKLLLAASKHE
jgi:XTP/dITP diphosphohydrolase